MSHNAKKTVLVVNSNVNILLLMRGILQNSYRVLLAADAESASRLLRIRGLKIDMAVVDRKIPGLPADELGRCMREKRPRLSVKLMDGFIENGVVRLRAQGESGRPSSDSLVQAISGAFAHARPVRKAKGTCARRSHVSTAAAATCGVDGYAAGKVMIAAR
jgi:DNA-binding NtrC family response regulator